MINLTEQISAQNEVGTNCTKINTVITSTMYQAMVKLGRVKKRTVTMSQIGTVK